MTHADPSAPPVVVDVALAPQLIGDDAAAHRRTVFIVVDVIRATTSIGVLLERGCRRLRVAATVAQARQVAADARVAGNAPRLTLAGEVGGLPPAGLDYGNSPAAFAQGDFSGADVVLATSNGTRALFACAGGAATLVGALRNAGAVAHAAVEHALAAESDASGASPAAPWTICVVCSGAFDRPAMDDTICAGVIAGAVLDELRAAGRAVVTGSGAQIALAVRDVARSRGLAAALADTWAARAIVEVGLAADLAWCAALDASALVPYVAATDPEQPLLLIERWSRADAGAAGG
ncbi:MAG TPA: 2-phosphosulfolactate phosphatase [Ktedonobacterales bacterium]|nr:2-phosphosulfolactate phosphatase [Ktedonobacterales bacterium]